MCEKKYSTQTRKSLAEGMAEVEKKWEIAGKNHPANNIDELFQ